MSTTRPRPHISVVVPSFGCERCIAPLHAALVPVLAAISPAFEIVMVEDHSPQGDWGEIAALAARDPRVRGVKLTRNFGQHNAIAAGLAAADGDWVVVMDCDLQDRPEEVARLYAKAQEGYDCVFGRRVHRADAAMKVATSRLFSVAFRAITRAPASTGIGNFSIISRRVVRELRLFKEGRRNYVVQVNWLGFPLAVIDVEHAARHAGETSYSLGKRLRHAASTILSQSTRPLYASAVLGLMMAIGAVVMAGYFIIRKLTYGYGVDGWASVMVSLFFLFGVLFLNLGVLGLYLASVFDEVKGRPPFVVERTTDEMTDDERRGPDRRSGGEDAEDR